VLADAELPHDEHIQERRTCFNIGITNQRDAYQVSGRNLCGQHRPTHNAVLAIAQTNIDKWARLLIATGGALNPENCYW
jgi:hypothetical protein